MMQVKIFENTDVEKLQEQINQFLEDEIDARRYYSPVDIKMLSHGDMVTATVIYKRPTF